MPLHNRYEIMTKILNLDQPPRYFVKYFTTALCIFWSFKMKDELKSFVELWMKINKQSQSTFLFDFGMHFHFSIPNLNFQNAAELNTTETEVETLAKDITEVRLDIWGMHGNSYTSPGLHVRFQTHEGTTYYFVHWNGKRGWSALCRTVF